MEIVSDSIVDGRRVVVVRRTEAEEKTLSDRAAEAAAKRRPAPSGVELSDEARARLKAAADAFTEKVRALRAKPE